MDQVKPWYQSSSMWGGLIAVGAAVLGVMGVGVDDQADITKNLTMVLGGAGGLLAWWGRWRATKRIG